MIYKFSGGGEANAYPDQHRIKDNTNGAVSNSMQNKSHLGFIQFSYPRNYNIARELGLSIEDSKRAAYYLTWQQAQESGYGTSNGFKLRNNRSGFMNKSGTINYGSHDAHDSSILNSFQNNNNWLRALRSKDMKSYIYTLQSPNSSNESKYESTKTPEQYYNDMKVMTTFKKNLDDYINSGATDQYTYNDYDDDDVQFAKAGRKLLPKCKKNS